MNIRAATPADIPPVVDLWKEMWDYHTKLDPDRYRASPAAEQVIAGWIEENIRGERSLVLVAENGGGPIGYLLAMILENPPVVFDQFYGYISEIGVTESAQGKGTGRGLLGEADKWFRDRGVRFVEANISEKTPGALRFWKREGYDDYLVRLRRTF